MATPFWWTCRQRDGMRPAKFRPDRYIAKRVMVCQYFPTWRPSATFDFKNFNIWSCDCHCGPNVLLYAELHRNWFTHSTSRRPQLQNVQCAVARQRPLPWQPNRGGHVGDMMGCDHPSCVLVGRLVGELWHFEYISNMAAVRHFEL